MSKNVQVSVNETPDTVTFIGANGEALLTADLLSLNTCITLSQEGLDRNNASFVETSTFRLREAIKERYEVDLTLVQAYQIGTTAGKMFRELVASF